ncbi:MAG: hypothetical protein IT562_13250, partial [Alphaproteobacteria bacterium]|nr:hypothetical protein [Alphaproteobacteria bacterium]
DARKPFLPMIADALADPDEVWAALEWTEAEQRVIVRRRYIARFDVAGRREVAIAVFEWTGAYWRAVTAFAPRGGQAKAARKDEYLARQGRAGVRIYARPEDVAEERPGGGGPAGRPGG